MAEKVMRRLIVGTAVPLGTHMTVAEAGAVYIEHLEVVMERKRTTIADYRRNLTRHLGPFFGGRPMDKIDRARVEAYLMAKKHDGLSSKTVAITWRPEIPLPTAARRESENALPEGMPVCVRS